MSAYSGDSTGFVKERFLRQRRYIPNLTVAAEAANAIAVSIEMTTFQEALNEYVVADEQVILEIQLLDADGLQAVVGDYTMAETGAGLEISNTAQPRLIIATSAAGVAQVTVTDVSGTSTDNLHMIVRPLNIPGFAGYVEIQFA
jgi:hypothetical protein